MATERAVVLVTLAWLLMETALNNIERHASDGVRQQVMKLESSIH